MWFQKCAAPEMGTQGLKILSLAFQRQCVPFLKRLTPTVLAAVHTGKKHPAPVQEPNQCPIRLEKHKKTGSLGCAPNACLDRVICEQSISLCTTLEVEKRSTTSSGRSDVWWRMDFHRYQLTLPVCEENEASRIPWISLTKALRSEPEMSTTGLF